MPRCAVLGSPIAHSLSPALHRAAYRHLGLADWHYEQHDVDEQRLPTFLDGLTTEWCGLSLTQPLKAAILPLLDEVTPLAQRLDAVNTVLLDWSGDRVRLTGHNTDVHGVVAALQGIGVHRITDGACVIGAGATAASALAAVIELGASQVTVVARRPGAAGPLLRAASSLGVAASVVHIADAARVFARSQVTVSTLPAGAADALVDRVVPGGGAFLDVVYKGWPTPLARAWYDAGGSVAGGAAMLVHQAIAQVELMTGRSDPGLLGAMVAALPPDSLTMELAQAR